MELQFFVVLPNYNIKYLKIAWDVQQDLRKKFREEKELFTASHESVEFVAGYTPEDDECFELRPFELPENLRKAIRNPERCDDLARSEITPGNIKAVIGASAQQNGDVERVIFKQIDSSKVVDRSRFTLVSDGDTLNKWRDNALIIPDRVDAVWENGALYFSSYGTTRQFLPLDEVFREASDQDIEKLLSGGILVADDIGKLHEIADGWCRKRMSMISQNPLWDKVSIRKICKHVDAEFDVVITTRPENGKEVIVLPDERKELKDLLRALNEDFIKSALSNTRYLTNSKKPL